MRFVLTRWTDGELGCHALYDNDDEPPIWEDEEVVVGQYPLDLSGTGMRCAQQALEALQHLDEASGRTYPFSTLLQEVFKAGVSAGQKTKC